MVGAISRGLTVNDFDTMTIGQIIDYVIGYNNMMLEDDEEEETIRTATQADFDAF